MEQCVARLGRGRRILHGIDLLLDRIWLARQQGLVDLRAVDRERDAIGRHQIAGGEQHDVAGHDVGDWQFDRLAVAQDLGTERDRPLERVRGRFGAMFLHHVEASRQDDDEDNDRKARDIACRTGNRGGGKQDRDQRIGEAAEKIEQQVAPPLGRDFVRTIAVEPRCGLSSAQAFA